MYREPRSIFRRAATVRERRLPAPSRSRFLRGWIMRVQLHRALSKLGWGSRGQAWAWIRAGEVRVDGRLVTDPLTWVDLDHQRITRNDQEAPPSAGPLTLALHKPR